MFKITESNRMILTRGDSCNISIDLYDEEGNVFIPEEGDTILFTIKTHLYDEEPLLTKEGVDIDIDSEDTKDLNVGTYYYDVKILFADGGVQTILPVNYFEIKHNVGDWNEQDNV